LLGVDGASCWDRSDDDYDAWWASTGKAILEAGQSAVAPVAAFCGKTPTSNKDLKMQIDGIGFDRAEGFLTSQLSSEEIYAAQNLSIVLQRGSFATDAAQTYLAGALPQTLVDNMESAVAHLAANHSARPLYYAYFSHRHALYGVAEFFGWEWNLYGIPPGMVQTATTIWFELRTSDDGSGYEVFLYSYAPHCGIANYTECPRSLINLPTCTAPGGGCTLDEFKALVTSRIDRTGSYATLCAVASPSPPSASWDTIGLGGFIGVIVGCLIFGTLLGILLTRALSRTSVESTAMIKTVNGGSAL